MREDYYSWPSKRSSRVLVKAGINHFDFNLALLYRPSRRLARIHLYIFQTLIERDICVFGFPEKVRRDDLGVDIYYLSTSKNTLVQYDNERKRFYKKAINETGIVQIRKEVLTYDSAPMSLTPKYIYDTKEGGNWLITESLTIKKTIRLSVIYELSKKLLLERSEERVRLRLSELISNLCNADKANDFNYQQVLQYENWNYIDSAIEHGDFNYWNIGTTKSGDLRLIDWEYANHHGIYGIDFLQYFYNRYCKKLSPRIMLHLLEYVVRKYDLENRHIFLFIARELESGNVSRKIVRLLSLCVRKF